MSTTVSRTLHSVTDPRQPLDVPRLRADFPILQQRVHDRRLVYLDNAATSQKPQAVIDAVSHYYERDNANIHRGVHTLSERATEDYEGARETVRRFLNAEDLRETIFVRGATEGINLVAQSFVRPRLAAGDEILITEMEHHSNIVPWQLLCEQTGAKLRVLPITDAGELDLERLDEYLTTRTRFLAVVQVSNSLGTVNPVRTLIEKAHALDVPVLVDGAQAVPHMPVDVQALGCDFYVLSGHKMYAPTGIGVLYGRREWLEEMIPYQGGGDMIRMVTFDKTLYNDLPYKFEAGTPHIAGGIGLGAAVDYLQAVNLEVVASHEAALMEYATAALSDIPGLRIIGNAAQKAGAISFVMDTAHPHDIGTILDHEGVAIRTGHHCTMPVMERFQVPATARASFGLYNDRDDIDALVEALHKVRRLFA